MTINPIDSNWFQDAGWTGTITPAVTSAQNEYTIAQTDVTNYLPFYTAAQASLQAALAGPLVTNADLVNLNNQRNSFASVSATYEGLVATLQAKSVALITAFKQQQAYVDSAGDTLLQSYVDQLMTEVGLQLTRTGVDTTTLPFSLATANLGRASTKISFNSSLTSYQLIEESLTDARVTLLSLQDQKLSAQADVAYWTLKLNRDIASGQPPAVITADTNAKNAAIADLANQTAAVASQLTLVANLEITRDSAKTTLSTALTNYNNSLNNLTTVLQNAYNTNNAVPQDFAAAIANEQAAVNALVAQNLAIYIQHDQDLHALLLTAFPTDPPNSVKAAIDAKNQDSVDQINSLVKNLNADEVTKLLGSINVPQLPATGSLSMNDLMRFINAIQLVIGRLADALRQSDNQIDSLRMKVWDLQLSATAQQQTSLFAWAQTIIAADEQYNLDAATDNNTLSTQLQQQLISLISNTSFINQYVIDELNQQIHDQNQRGQDVTTALNNSNFIVVDTKDANQNVQPNITNTADIFDQDVDTSLPSANTDVAPFTNPATIPDYPQMPPPDFSIFNHFPTPLPGFDIDSPSPPTLIPPDPSVLPTPAEVAAFNQAIDAYNQVLYPIRERLAAHGITFTPIDNFYLRPYTPVRSISDVITPDTIFTAVDVYEGFVSKSQKKRAHKILDDKGKAPPPFDRTLESDRVPVTESQHPTAQPTGTGAGILGANLLATPAKVADAVQTVLASTTFTNVISSLIESGALVGGLQSLTQLPTSIVNYSQMGLVRSDMTTEVGATAAGRVDDVTKALSTNTALALIAAAGDIPGLKDKVLGLIKQSGAQKLSKDEIEQLIAALLYLLQLLLLLVAALLLAAAGGNESLNSVLEKVFRSRDEERGATAIQNLRNIGVPNIPDLNVSSPTFVQDFADTFAPLFSSTQGDDFAAQVTSTFSSNNQSVSFSSSTSTTGSALTAALSGSPIDVRGQIRESLTRIEIENAEILHGEIARQTIKRLQTTVVKPPLATGPEIPEAIDTRRPFQPSGGTGTSTAPQEAPSTTTPSQTPPTTTPPTLGGLTNDERDTIVLAVAQGLITHAQGGSLAEALVNTRAIGTDPLIATLLARAVQEGRRQASGSSAPGVTLATPRIPESAGIPGLVAAPQTLPKTAIDLLKDAFQALSQQSDNKNYAQEVLIAFAKEIEPLTNFYERSLSLILDPGAVFVKNFSIFTMDGSMATKQTSLSIPISG